MQAKLPCWHSRIIKSDSMQHYQVNGTTSINCTTSTSPLPKLFPHQLYNGFRYLLVGFLFLMTALADLIFMLFDRKVLYCSRATRQEFITQHTASALLDIRCCSCSCSCRCRCCICFICCPGSDTLACLNIIKNCVSRGSEASWFCRGLLDRLGIANMLTVVAAGTLHWRSQQQEGKTGILEDHELTNTLRIYSWSNNIIGWYKYKEGWISIF